MATNSHSSPALDFLLNVDSFYARLNAVSSFLGGQLLYAGELDGDARALLVAANVAGAASMAASASPDAQKQSIRDGIADFLVTSLDEALRILKNEIRKGETVSVCVAQSPETLAHEMFERGVLPNLIRPTAPEAAAFLRQGAQLIEPLAGEPNQIVLAWSVAASPALWLPKLDAVALHCLNGNSAGTESAETLVFAQRWLRLAPRYLGRMAANLRLLRTTESIAANFIEELRRQISRAEMNASVDIQLIRADRAPEQYQFTPQSC